MKKGFTIVELLVVVAIIGILLGIVGVASVSAVKTARKHRGEAMANAFSYAINAYYSQKGSWPGSIEALARNYSLTSDTTADDRANVTIAGDKADEVFRQIVRLSIGSNASMPLIDVSALFVARSREIKGNGCNDVHGDKTDAAYCGDKNCAYGMNFTDAVKRGVSIEDMAFGWQGKKYGRFRRFVMKYNVKTDSVTVTIPDGEEE